MPCVLVLPCRTLAVKNCRCPYGRARPSASCSPARPRPSRWRARLDDARTAARRPQPHAACHAYGLVAGAPGALSDGCAASAALCGRRVRAARSRRAAPRDRRLRALRTPRRLRLRRQNADGDGRRCGCARGRRHSCSRVCGSVGCDRAVGGAHEPVHRELHGRPWRGRREHPLARRRTRRLAQLLPRSRRVYGPPLPNEPLRLFGPRAQWQRQRRRRRRRRRRQQRWSWRPSPSICPSTYPARGVLCARLAGLVVLHASAHHGAATPPQVCCVLDSLGWSSCMQVLTTAPRLPHRCAVCSTRPPSRCRCPTRAEQAIQLPYLPSTCPSPWANSSRLSATRTRGPRHRTRVPRHRTLGPRHRTRVPRHQSAAARRRPARRITAWHRHCRLAPRCCMRRRYR